MNLQYDITVVGQNQIRSVIRGVEAEILASNKRMTAGIRGTSAAGAGRPRLAGGATGSGAAEAKALTRVRISEEEKVARTKERLHQRYVAFEGREIERITRQRLAAFEKERVERTKLAESMSKGVGTAVHNTARAAMTTATVIGGALIGSALYDQVNVQKGASRVANQGMHPELKGEIAKQSQDIRGFTGEQSINALDEFVQKSGDLKGGMAAWSMLGELATATSTDFSDMGKAAGQAYNLIAENVKDPTERLKQLKDVMTVLAVQGNMASVEMRDLAPNLGKLSATSRRYGGDPIKTLEELGALGQLAVKSGGATDAAEETTSIARFTEDLIKDASGKKGKKNKGFNPFTDDNQTHLMSPTQIIGDIMDKTHGNLPQIQGMFGARGMKALSGLSNVYLKAFTETKAATKGDEKTKTKAAETAGRAAITAGVGELTGAHKDIKEAANLRYQDADIQFEEATKAFNRAIGEQLLPAVTKLIPKFVELVPAATYLTEELVKVVNALADNPIEGIGLLILGKVSADIAAAGIGKGLAFLLTGIIKSAVPGATGGLVGPAIGLAGAGVGLAARGITGAATGVTSALGVAGAAGGVALGAAAGLAAAGVGAAAYEGKKLYDVTQGFTDWGTDVAKAGTPEDYDAMMKKAGLGPSAAGGAEASAATTAAAAAQTDAAKDMKSAAADLRVASANIRMADPNRSKPIVARAP